VCADFYKGWKIDSVFYKDWGKIDEQFFKTAVPRKSNVRRNPMFPRAIDVPGAIGCSAQSGCFPQTYVSRNRCSAQIECSGAIGMFPFHLFVRLAPALRL
jgi:hypothetical protein